ncbi:hypothetical protein [Chelatococcus sp.]|uniref:hypothetical protein n=1 Tax=Chelatococcus sp. TaxID=1953771 RepID=UPI001ECC6547|nr:hypothetical protein [Chelatococcus sp.]MBX3543755.1 hypothetical protein [Chelatococcus sp.]
MAKRPAKSETLTIRLDPKTRFMLEFISRVKGQTITTVVERALVEAASTATIETGFGHTDWKAFWDVSEGVRQLRLASTDEVFPTYEEERRFAFARTHEVFFWDIEGKTKTFNRFNIEVLWPNIDEYISIWDSTKTSDHWAAGRRMKSDLEDAKIEPPRWPPPSRELIPF